MNPLLLVNLGTPDSAEVKDVGRYLNEFLMDKEVITLPYLLRLFLVRAIIVPFRKKNSAHAYQKVFGERGSPLRYYLEELAEVIRRKQGRDVLIGMRYGNPSLEGAFKEAQKKGYKKLDVMVLYPQYATSSTESSLLKIDSLKEKYQIEVQIQHTFFREEKYLKALENQIQDWRSHNKVEPDLWIFSYHGIPHPQIEGAEKRFFKTTLALNKYPATSKCLDLPLTEALPCLQLPNCCAESKSYCYRAQCVQTTQTLSQRLGIRNSVSTFQSRLGRAEWTTPATDQFVMNLPKEIKTVAVICPSFISDCLETLEEIGVRLKADFESKGDGRKLYLLPCLNQQFADVL